MARKLCGWVVIMLIVLFFAIPVCSFVASDHVNNWPKCPTNFVYNLICR